MIWGRKFRDEKKRWDFELVLLVSCARSGTSWLNRLLGSHPEIAIGKESYVLELADHVLRKSDRFFHDRIGPLRYLSRQELCRACADLCLSILSAKVDRERYFLEKTPTHIRYAPLFHELFPRLRVVHLIRDGRDVVFSMNRAKEERGHKYASTFRGCVEEWAHHRSVLEWAERNPKNCHEVRYENLLSDPKKELASTLSWLGLEWCPQVEQATQTERTRHPSADTQAKGFRGKWADAFSQEECEVFREVAGDLLIELGYENSNAW